MAYGGFTERTDRPDLGRAEEALGAAQPLWDDVARAVAGLGGTGAAWRFYGRNYGWALAYKRRGRALAALFPDVDALTVLVVLSGEQTDAALTEDRMSAATKQQIAALPRFREGCWVFLRVEGIAGDAKALMDDALRLIALRAGQPLGDRGNRPD